MIKNKDISSVELGTERDFVKYQWHCRGTTSCQFYQAHGQVIIAS